MKIVKKITLIEKKKKKDIPAKGKTRMAIKEVIWDNFDITVTFNKFFVKIVPNLNTPPEKDFKFNFGEIDDPVSKTISNSTYLSSMKTNHVTLEFHVV